MCSHEGSPVALGSIALPSGQRLANRLVKVATYEHGAALFGGPPNTYHYALYSQWAQGDWGMIITGNVQVCRDHLTLGRDMVVPPVLNEKTVEPFQTLAAAIHGCSSAECSPSCNHHRATAIMQLSHAGRQSANIIGGRKPLASPLAPSAVPLGRGRDAGVISSLVHAALFQTPRRMTAWDIEAVMDAFVRGASLAHEAGFDGVELHASHGYLLAEFIDPKTNLRTDEYSVNPAENSLRLLRTIIDRIREQVPRTFILGVKVNAADYSNARQSVPSAGASRPDHQVFSQTVEDGTEIQAHEHVKLMASWRTIDFIEISGGDYENPDFMADASITTPRQALFSRFASRSVRTDDPGQYPRTSAPLILLTGGLRAPLQMCSALQQEHADLLGVGRMAVLCPDLPRVMSRDGRATGDADDAAMPFADIPKLHLNGAWTRFLPKIKLVGAGAEMAWYIVAMRSLAFRQEPDRRMGSVGAIIRMWSWVSPSTTTRRGDAWTWSPVVHSVWLAVVLIATWVGATTPYLSFSPDASALACSYEELEDACI
ncbi:FMN-linked oxidoreductase [Punctularia strigosozonata HHB-11173 SS5]|uniref:FMN-linked oxidoreductase n=1 Tax=Punctularia strigosozonata (strain HHB-11173) TaxID=741275 RepID=UPI0004417F0F|nr:FMN-linked oxidoreductase [Punctularia strigosozonata HHB-11173 SS5]EIN08209.1 FMN-linked oxidoreductase [Punctularia strigosozonata HHB-11173 SS5]